MDEMSQVKRVDRTLIANGAIIENEIEQAKYLLDYFDNWGSRCYLFSSQSANENGEYGPFDFNYDKMLEMNCKYILSGHKINDETGQISLL